MIKAFTLIELMVVVIILGILSSVGFSIYKGFVNSTESTATKSNCSYVKKYIKNELALCKLGNQKVMNSKLNCQNYIANDVAVACMDSLAPSFPNDFDPKKDQRAGVYTAFFANSLSNPCNSSDKGRISVRQNNNPDKMIIECCGDTNSHKITELFTININ